MSCDGVVKEAEGIVDVCYKVQEGLLPCSAERLEISKFISLLNTQKIYYTAAGYFIINKGTLLGLLNVTTTYFIILVQFKQYL